MKKQKKDQPKSKDDKMVTFAFSRQNYRFLIIAIAVITVGFLLMIGGGSDDPNIFSDKIFNFRRMTLAPILVLAGYIIGIYAIMKTPKE